MPTFKHLLLSLASFSVLAASAAYADDDSVTIRQNDQELVEEFRDNGFVYAVKITPEKGFPYYLVRADGTQGDFIRTDPPDMLIPSWPILSW